MAVYVPRGYITAHVEWQCAYWEKKMFFKTELSLCIFLQFPGGSDNYLTISGSSHPFLSSSEVGLYIFTLHGNLFSLETLFMATKPALEVESVMLCVVIYWNRWEFGESSQLSLTQQAYFYFLMHIVLLSSSSLYNCFDWIIFKRAQNRWSPDSSGADICLAINIPEKCFMNWWFGFI